MNADVSAGKAQWRRCITRFAMDGGSISSSSRDLLTVDLRGMKAALVAHARTRGVSISDLVRDVLVEAMGRVPSLPQESATNPLRSTDSDRVRLTVRLARRDAEVLASRARDAKLPQCTYLAGLIAGIPALAEGAGHAEHVAALAASNAELVMLSTSLNHLARLLREGSTQAALEYRETLRTLVADVRRHLNLASSVVSDLLPRHRSS